MKPALNIENQIEIPFSEFPEFLPEMKSHERPIVLDESAAENAGFSKANREKIKDVLKSPSVESIQKLLKDLGVMNKKRFKGRHYVNKKQNPFDSEQYINEKKNRQKARFLAELFPKFFFLKETYSGKALEVIFL